jgi:hypothetical protein
MKNMTVKELIEKLEKIENKDLQVVIQIVDPTDYVYYNEIEDVDVKNATWETVDGFKIRRRVVLDGGIV